MKPSTILQVMIIGFVLIVIGGLLTLPQMSVLTVIGIGTVIIGFVLLVLAGFLEWFI